MSDNRITGGPKDPHITRTPSLSEQPNSSKTFTVKQRDEPKAASQTDDAKKAGAALFSDPVYSGRVTTDLNNTALNNKDVAGQITAEGGFLPAALKAEGTPRTTATSTLNTPNLAQTPLQQGAKAELEKNGIPVPAALISGEPRTVADTSSAAPQP